MEVLGFILVLFALMVILPLTISLVLWMIENAIRNTATFLDAYAAEFDYQATAR